MVTTKDNSMGRFAVEVELTNNDDEAGVRAGTISPQQVRREKVRGVVDSGATRLVILESVAQRLGLEVRGTTRVRYADGRTADRGIARDVHLRYGDRDGVFSAIIEPDRESALIGAIVMEDLDLIVDCAKQMLVPRDPKQIVSEVE